MGGEYFSQLHVAEDRSLGETRIGQELVDEQGNAQILERNGLRPAGLEPATLCLEVRLVFSTVFSQLLPLVSITQLRGVCFRSQRLRPSLLDGRVF